MSTSVRTLEIRIIQTGDASKGLKGLLGNISPLSLAAGAATAGIALTGAAVVGLGAALGDMIGEASAAQDVQTELNAVLESTQGIAGVTADDVNRLASEFQNVTRFEDETIVAGQSMLLTFTNIGKDVFPAATEAMLNMGQKFGSVDQAAVQLGKALQDPIGGVTALRRVGVALSEAQEQQIKDFMAVGDIASAQKVILSELETEFGGLAVAAGTTFAGQMDIMRNKLGEVKETIGAAFLPVLQQVAGLLITGLNSPEFQALLAGLSEFLTGTLIPAISALIGWLKNEVMPRFAEAGRQIREILGPAFQQMRSAIQEVANALGISKSKIDILDIALKALKVTLDVIVLVAKGVAAFFNGMAAGINAVAGAIRSVINRFNEMKEAAAAAMEAMPEWLVPGSPTPFEMGLRGIGKAMSDLNAQFGGLAPAGSLAMLAPGGGGGTVIVNMGGFTYAPAVSLASQYEAETVLAPMILRALRERGVAV